MKKEYEIESSRHDIAGQTIDRFTVTGDTVKACDKQAIKRFKPQVFARNNSWDDLILKRIDMKPVIRDVISGGRLKALRKHKLPDDYDGILPRDGD